jgi:hypothetical protein
MPRRVESGGSLLGATKAISSLLCAIK